MVTIREVKSDEKKIIDEIVTIHLNTFTGFFLTFMGRGFLRQMYQSYCDHEESGLLVAEKLENQNAWYDAANIENGESIPEKINEGLKYATHYVLFWSRKACESNWVRAELNAAFVRMMANKCKIKEMSRKLYNK